MACKYWSLFISVFILGLLTILPASWILQLTPINNMMIANKVKMYNIQGSIWNASIEMINLNEPALPYKQLKNIKWRFNWFGLLNGKFELVINFGEYGDQNLRGQGEFGYSLFDSWYANNVELEAVLTPFSPMIAKYLNLPKFVELNINGNAQINLTNAHYNGKWCTSGDANVKLNDIELVMQVANLQLNNISANLECVSNAVSIVAQQTSDQVISSLTANLRTDLSYQGELTIIPQEQFPQFLVQPLQWLAQTTSHQYEYQIIF